MKSYEDIISRFDNIQDLPISEEDLGAYLEGNLNLYEMEYINDVMRDNPMIEFIMDETSIHFTDNSAYQSEDLTEEINDNDMDYQPHSHHVENYETDINEIITSDLISYFDWDTESLFDELGLDLPELPFI